MKDFRKYRGRRAEIARLVLGCVGVIALTFLAFVAARASWNMYGKFAAAAAAHTSAQGELTALRTQHERVKKNVEVFTTERGLEAQVRERYGVARPGEGEIDIVRQASTTAASPTTQQGFWARIWDTLFVW